MTPFSKPGRRRRLPRWAREAGEAALADAGISYEQGRQAFAGYVYGDRPPASAALYGSASPHPDHQRQQQLLDRLERALPRAPGVPRRRADCAMAPAFEKMQPGSLSAGYNARANPMERHVRRMLDLRAPEPSPMAPQIRPRKTASDPG